jgi:hypothetical protein
MFRPDRLFSVIACAMLAGCLAVGVVGVTTAKAQSATPTVAAFLANPQQLLQQNPNGGQKLIDEVQELALQDAATFKLILGLVPNANDQQKSAIAFGLAQATKALLGLTQPLVPGETNQQLAADWQQQIAAITDPTFKIAATNGFGDVQIGAVGGPLGGPLGGGGAGPSGAGGGGAPENFFSGTNTPFFSYTGNTTGISTSVSP